MIGLGLLDPCSVLGLIKDYPSENLAQNWTIQQLGYVRRWAKKAEKLMNETGKFCQATLQWANRSVVASRPLPRYPLSRRIYCETETPCEGSQLFSQEQWSICEGFPCARNEFWLCLKGLVQSWKCPHLQGSSWYGKVRRVSRQTASANEYQSILHQCSKKISMPRKPATNL